jgi:hypothetical protein
MLQKMGTHDIHDFLRAMWVSKYGDLKQDDLFYCAQKTYRTKPSWQPSRLLKNGVERAMFCLVASFCQS